MTKKSKLPKHQYLEVFSHCRLDGSSLRKKGA
jgi:hypothetical protein